MLAKHLSWELFEAGDNTSLSIHMLSTRLLVFQEIIIKNDLNVNPPIKGEF